MLATEKKITLATFKSFIRKNRDALLIRTISHFDGQCDGVRNVHDTFHPIVGFDPVAERQHICSHNLGLAGVWLVLGGRDYFRAWSDETHSGIYVSNCCGSFILAVAK